MFTEQELADLGRAVEIALAALTNVSARVMLADPKDQYAAMSKQWVEENSPILLRAEEALKRERS